MAELSNGIVTHNGEKISIKELSKKYNINYNTLYNRIFTSGWTVKKALDTKINDYYRCIKYKNIEYTVKKLSEKYNINYNTLYGRLFVYKWSVEKAIETGVVEKHGLSDSSISEYNIWVCMKSRCHTRTNPSFHRYGERGISVCNRWKYSFTNFIDDMGFKPDSKLTLERINNDGNYEPDNCRWATKKEQSRNTSTNRMFVYKGENKCLAEWVEIIGFPRQAIVWRIKNGWSIEDAFETPIGRWR